MKSLTSGPVPFLLALLVSFTVGLTFNRLLHETTRAAGFQNSDSTPPSWLGAYPYQIKDECIAVPGTGSSGTELMEGEESEFAKVGTAAGEVGVAVKTEEQLARDKKMEALTVKFGEPFFDKSVSYSGTNHRLRRIVRRALAGEAINIAVLGGSITRGVALPDAEQINSSYHAFFWKWWLETFPNAKHTYHPVGLGAFGSVYMADCFLEHLPEDLDLVLLELAVNDQRNDEDHRAFDELLRSMLTLRSAPAVIALEMFQIQPERAMSAGGSNQLDSSRYMDVPTLSLRNPLLPEVMHHPSRIPDFFGWSPLSWGAPVDPRHAGLRGHYAMGCIIQMHVWRQILHVEAHNTEADRAREKLGVSRIGTVPEEEQGLFVPHSFHTEEEYVAWQADRSYINETDWGSRPEDAEVVPRMSLLDKFDPVAFIPLSVPRCRSLSGTREKLALATTTMGDKLENGTVTVGQGDGWFEWQSSPQKQYIISRSPKSLVTFNVTVGFGEVKVLYLKSWEYGLGTASCWIDGEWGRKVDLDGYWTTRVNIVQMATIKTGISPGDHILRCEKTGTGEFRIASVITA